VRARVGLRSYVPAPSCAGSLFCMNTSVAQVAIVDDDPSVGRAVGRLVRSLGMQSETFTSGEAFFRAVATMWKPHCVVLDVQMPGMNGLEVQRQMIEQELRVPVIFITAHEDRAVAERAIAAGAMGFLYKPFAAESLKELICRALENKG
jgi:FixJ family two-component response regulator